MTAANGFRRRRVRDQMRTVGFQVARIAPGHKGPRDELRRSARRHEIRKDFVIAGLREHDVNHPGPVRLLFGMNVLEGLHVLANDEEVILALVYRFEFLDRIAGGRM